MIVISGALVLVALVLLVVGLTMTDLPFVYASIAVSLLAFVFLVIGVLQRRGEQTPGTSGEAPGHRPAEEPGGRHADADTDADAVPVDVGRRLAFVPTAQTVASTPVTADTATSDATTIEAAPSDRQTGGSQRLGSAPVAVRPATADVPIAALFQGGGLVLVVSGRPRYHVDGCRYLSGKDVDEIDVFDARDEGFSPCGVCKPDLVLVAEREADQLEQDDVAPQAEVGGDDLARVDRAEQAPADAEPVAELVDEPDPEPDVEPGPEPDVEPGPVPDVEPGPVLDEEPDAVLDEEPDEEPDVEPDPEPVPTSASGGSLVLDVPPAAVATEPAVGALDAAARTTSRTAARTPKTPKTPRPRRTPASTGAPATPVRTAAEAPAAVPVLVPSTRRRSTAARGVPAAAKAPTAGPRAAGAPEPAAPARAATTTGTRAAAGAARRGTVVVIPDRGRFHRTDCRYVRDAAGALELTRAQAGKQGYDACGVCKP